MGALAEIELANLGRLADGRCFEWEAVGSGEDLVWFEGGPGFWAHLGRPDVALLADRFRCHLINAPGCGRTSPPASKSQYNAAADAAFYEEACQVLGLGPVTLMGHSWGGTLAVVFAARYPERVRRLVIIDGWCGLQLVDRAEAQAEERRAFDRVRDRPWFADAEHYHGPEDMTEEVWAAWWRRRFPIYFADPESALAWPHVERVRREVRMNMDADCYDDDAVDLRPELGRVRCPTLVVCGEHDFICGPAWNRPIAAGIPGAELHVIAGVGHLPQYEAPDEFRSVLFDWMARTTPVG
jgi:proline iminopeptidase